MSPYIICIDGNIGAGKTTLLNKLEQKGYVIFKEPIHSWIWILTNCYSDPKRWAFTLQTAILQSMSELKKQIEESNSKLVFVERCPVSTIAFTDMWYSQGCLSEGELKLIQNLYDLIGWIPDLTIMLNTNSNKCLERITSRGRDCEKSMTLNHLIEVESKYNNICKNIYTKEPIILNNDTDIDTLVTKVEQILFEIDYK